MFDAIDVRLYLNTVGRIHSIIHMKLKKHTQVI